MDIQPLVTIITPSFNHARDIEATLLSVRQQDYPYIEHLVLDMGSTDGTLDILHKYEDKITLISEKDYGRIYAISRGFHYARGEILGWLNCGDVYVPSAIHTVVAHYTNQPDHDFIYGDVEVLDKSGKSYGVRTHFELGGWTQLNSEIDFICQPTTFCRGQRWIADEYGESYHYTLGDYWKQVLKASKPHYLPVVLAKKQLPLTAIYLSGAVKRLEKAIYNIQSLWAKY